MARFTIDSWPELGVYHSGSVWVDTNGNFTFDPDNPDFTNRDITYVLGFTTDNLFAGNFSAPVPGAVADGFDKLAAYGRTGSNFRWLIDTDSDGVPNPATGIVDPTGINGFPVAGNFDGNPLNGDEVGLLANNVWYFDMDHDYKVDLPGIALTLTGLPLVGDFDGDGFDDLGTWKEDKFTFLLTAGVDRAWLPDGAAPVAASIDFGFIGTREKPVAADMDQDGIDDVGLWVPDRAGVAPEEQGEWYFLVSNDFDSTGDGLDLPDRSPGTLATLAHPFEPVPLGNDLLASYGDEFAVPVVGNFDPPLAPVSSLPVQFGTTNLDNPWDVNGNGTVTPLDALIVINAINAWGVGPITLGRLSAPYLDVNADGILTAMDVLAVINYINSQGAGTSNGEGEAESGEPRAESQTGVDSRKAIAALSSVEYVGLASATVPEVWSRRAARLDAASVDRYFGSSKQRAESGEQEAAADCTQSGPVLAVAAARAAAAAADVARDDDWSELAEDVSGAQPLAETSDRFFAAL